MADSNQRLTFDHIINVKVLNASSLRQLDSEWDRTLTKAESRLRRTRLEVSREFDSIRKDVRAIDAPFREQRKAALDLNKAVRDFDTSFTKLGKLSNQLRTVSGLNIDPQLAKSARAVSEEVAKAAKKTEEFYRVAKNVTALRVGIGEDSVKGQLAKSVAARSVRTKVPLINLYNDAKKAQDEKLAAAYLARIASGQTSETVTTSKVDIFGKNKKLLRSVNYNESDLGAKIFSQMASVQSLAGSIGHGKFGSSNDLRGATTKIEELMGRIRTAQGLFKELGGPGTTTAIQALGRQLPVLQRLKTDLEAASKVSPDLKKRILEIAGAFDTFANRVKAPTEAVRDLSKEFTKLHISGAPLDQLLANVDAQLDALKAGGEPFKNQVTAVEQLRSALIDMYGARDRELTAKRNELTEMAKEKVAIAEEKTLREGLTAVLKEQAKTLERLNEAYRRAQDANKKSADRGLKKDLGQLNADMQFQLSGIKKDATAAARKVPGGLTGVPMVLQAEINDMLKAQRIAESKAIEEARVSALKQVEAAKKAREDARNAMASGGGRRGGGRGRGKQTNLLGWNTGDEDGILSVGLPERGRAASFALEQLSGAASGLLLASSALQGNLQGMAFSLIFLKFNLVGTALAVGSLVVALGGFMMIVKTAINAFAALEPAAETFRNLTGSIEEGAAQMAFASAQARKFGFDIGDANAGLINLNKTFLASATNFKTVEDLAAGLGTSVDQASTIFSQAIGLQTGSLESLRQAGIKVTDQQAQYFNQLSRGQRVAEVSRLINEKFAGAAERHANTLGGAINRLQGALQNFFAQLGGPIVKLVLVPFIQALANLFNKLSDGFRAFSQSAAGLKLLARIGQTTKKILEELGLAGESTSDKFRNRAASGIYVFYRMVLLALQALLLFINLIKGAANAIRYFLGLIKPAIDQIRRFAQFLKNLNFGAIFRSIKQFVFDLPGLIKKGANFLLDLIPPDLIDKAKDIWNSLKDAFKDLPRLGKALASPFIEAFKTGAFYIGALVMAWKTDFANLQGITKAALDFIAGIIEFGLTVYLALFNAFIQTTVGIWKVGLGLLQGILSSTLAALRGDWDAAWDHFRDGLSLSWDGIKQIFKANLDLIVTLIDSFVEDVLFKFANLTNELQIGLVDGLRDIAVIFYKNFFPPILETIQRNTSTVVNAVIIFLKAIISPFSLLDLVSVVAQYITNPILTALDGLGEAMRQIGKDVALGFKEGVEEGAKDFLTPGWLESIWGKTTGLLGKVADLLGTHSRSEETYQIGLDVMQGFIDGIDKKKSEAAVNTANAFQAILNSITQVAGLDQAKLNSFRDLNLKPIVDAVTNLVRDISDATKGLKSEDILRFSEAASAAVQAISTGVDALNKVKELPPVVTESENVAWVTAIYTFTNLINTTVREFARNADSFELEFGKRDVRTFIDTATEAMDTLSKAVDSIKQMKEFGGDISINFDAFKNYLLTAISVFAGLIENDWVNGGLNSAGFFLQRAEEIVARVSSSAKSLAGIETSAINIGASFKKFHDAITGSVYVLGLALASITNGQSLLLKIKETLGIMAKMEFISVGEDIVTGIAIGMLNGKPISQLKAAANHLVDLVVQFLRTAAESKSPAQVTMPVGSDIVAGIAKGMEGNVSALRDSSDGVVNSIVNSLSSSTNGVYDAAKAMGTAVQQGVTDGLEGLDEVLDSAIKPPKTDTGGLSGSAGSDGGDAGSALEPLRPPRVPVINEFLQQFKDAGFNVDPEEKKGALFGTMSALIKGLKEEGIAIQGDPQKGAGFHFYDDVKNVLRTLKEDFGSNIKRYMDDMGLSFEDARKIAQKFGDDLIQAGDNVVSMNRTMEKFTEQQKAVLSGIEQNGVDRRTAVQETVESGIQQARHEAGLDNEDDFIRDFQTGKRKMSNTKFFNSLSKTKRNALARLLKGMHDAGKLATGGSIVTKNPMGFLDMNTGEIMAVAGERRREKISVMPVSSNFTPYDRPRGGSGNTYNINVEVGAGVLGDEKSKKMLADMVSESITHRLKVNYR